MTVYHDQRSASPDPLYRRRGRPSHHGGTSLDVYPHFLVRSTPSTAQIKAWARSLHLERRPAALACESVASPMLDFVFDFGTEIDGELEVGLRLLSPCTACVRFGESALEVEGIGLPMRVPDVPDLVEHRRLQSGGTHVLRFQPRGFRFVRLTLPEPPAEVTLARMVVHAWFAGRTREGDFTCSDALLQQCWQTSVYTARLCTREDAYWDGIKRDRLGWYGDARVTQLTMDQVFSNPVPAEEMLLQMPVDSWANHIPVYSLDGVAMLRQMLLRYGIRRSAKEIYRRLRALFRWIERTHLSAEGLFMRHDNSGYFFGIGFLDWSPMPVGGRFEELSWMQMRYLESLRKMADVATWLGHPRDARAWHRQASRLAPLLVDRFYHPCKGFIHTLNRSTRAWAKLEPNVHYRTTYVERSRLGPSGPSRHSSSLAAWAGLCTTPAQRRAVLRVLDRDSVAPVITGYFAYYEQGARALCGDVAGAVTCMRDYVGGQIARNDSATVWESYEPEVSTFERWALNTWPKSLCHGWSSGIVPIVNRHLVGVDPLAPGCQVVRLQPSPTVPCSFKAEVPTPYGPIRATRHEHASVVQYRVPREITLVGDNESAVRVTRT